MRCPHQALLLLLKLQAIAGPGSGTPWFSSLLATGSTSDQKKEQAAFASGWMSVSAKLPHIYRTAKNMGSQAILGPSWDRKRFRITAVEVTMLYLRASSPPSFHCR